MTPSKREFVAEVLRRAGHMRALEELTHSRRPRKVAELAEEVIAPLGAQKEEDPD